jgi:nicotinate-nucleotide adenylyltransferase
MKIGLLGGSFNPAHEGHLHISVEARKHLKLKQIWWIPTKQNPFKKTPNADFKTRLTECREITKRYSTIFIKDFEKNISSCYTIDLLESLTKKYPQHQFFWIMGADNMIKFHLWERWQDIIKLMPLIILDREDFFNKAIRSKTALYCRKLSTAQNITKCYFLKIKKSAISSTKIRVNTKKSST